MHILTFSPALQVRSPDVKESPKQLFTDLESLTVTQAAGVLGSFSTRPLAPYAPTAAHRKQWGDCIFLNVSEFDPASPTPHMLRSQHMQPTQQAPGIAEEMAWRSQLSFTEAHKWAFKLMVAVPDPRDSKSCPGCLQPHVVPALGLVAVQSPGS